MTNSRWIKTALFLLFSAVIWGYFFLQCRIEEKSIELTLAGGSDMVLEHFSSDYKDNHRVDYRAEQEFFTVKYPLKKETSLNWNRFDFGSRKGDIFLIRSIVFKQPGFKHYTLNLADSKKWIAKLNNIKEPIILDGKMLIEVSGHDAYMITNKQVFPQSVTAQFNCSLQDLCITVAVNILLFLLFSDLLAALIKKISFELPDKKENFILAATVSGAFTFVMGLSLPLQTYKMAQEIILFDMSTLLLHLCWLIPTVFIVMLALLFLISIRFGIILTIITAAITVLFVIENGPLAFGLPQLNGTIDAYHNVPRMLLHGALWLVLIVLAVVFQKKLYKNLHLVLLGACVLSAATLVDSLMKNTTKNHGTLIVPQTVPIGNTLKSVKYAAKNNIIIICLDAVTGEVASEVIKLDPELRSVFNGFTGFTNNIGMNVTTMFCTPGIFTGKYLTPDIPESEFTFGVYSKDSALKKYIDQGYGIFCRIGLPSLSYVYPEESGKKKYTITSPVDDPMWCWIFHELYTFKVSPFFMKEGLLNYYFYKVWPNRQNGNEINTLDLTFNRDDESHTFDRLANAGLLDDSFKGSFHYHHFNGGHQPFKYDQNGQRVDRSHIPFTKDWEGYRNRVWYEFKCVKKWMLELKKRSLYDDSVIIICADHGLEPHRQSPIPPRYRPLLMVKCRNSSAPYSETDIPTSHEKISTFLKSDIFNVKQEQLAGIFKTPLRKIHAPLNDGSVQVDTITSDMQLTRHKIFKDSKKLSPLKNNFKYSLYHVANKNFPDIAVSGMTTQIQGYVHLSTLPGELTFKVADKNSTYYVELDAVVWPNKGVDLIEVISDKFGTKTNFVRGESRIKLPGVKADKDSLVRLTFKRNAKAVGFMFITSLTVSRKN